MTDERYNHQTPAEFDDALSALVRAAFANDVDIEGGWDVSDGGTTSWAVEITRVSQED